MRLVVKAVRESSVFMRSAEKWARDAAQTEDTETFEQAAKEARQLIDQAVKVAEDARARLAKLEGLRKK